MPCRIFFALSLICIVTCAEAQFTYRLDQSTPVTVNGVPISLPWAGGINSAQVNTMDLDGDGDEDLVIFERMANKILPFINDHHVWRYAPDFASLFPAEVDQWMLLRDFNCDGRKDIFTHNNLGISVFVNVTPPGGTLKWRPFNQGFALFTQGFTAPVNLQVNATDVPGIDDVDGDGDLDILDARFAGIGSIEFHRNMSVENTGKCDSIQLVRITQTWGNFEECNCGEYLFDGSTCTIFGGKALHAAGKSILTLDTDHDGDRDLFFSEENCDRIYFLPNLGSKDSASMTGYAAFPSTSPIVNFPVFPATYFEDLTFDNVPDLIATTNIYAHTVFNIDFRNSFWLYKNTGSAVDPVFELVQKNFLQDQMIDVGDNAVPAFIDADGDGDLDMMISSYNSPRVSSGLFFYENTGTSSAAVFNQITDDYAGFSADSLFNARIQFADVNADGKQDLVFTATARSTGITSLYYIANKSAVGLDITSSRAVDTEFDIEVNEQVLMVDVDQDGAVDILKGTSVGALEYWKNSGRPGSFDFTLKNDSYLGLGISTDRQNPVATVADLNADGKDDLILGDQRGELTLFSDFRSEPTTGTKNIVWDTVSGTYLSKNLGARAWPAVANLSQSRQPSIIVGNLLGGLQFLKSDDSAGLPENPVVRITPNPANALKIFFIETDREIQVTMYSVLGVQINPVFTVPAQERYPVDCSAISGGVYILRLSVGKKTYSHRIIVP